MLLMNRKYVVISMMSHVELFSMKGSRERRDRERFIRVGRSFMEVERNRCRQIDFFTFNLSGVVSMFEFLFRISVCRRLVVGVKFVKIDSRKSWNIFSSGNSFITRNKPLHFFVIS